MPQNASLWKKALNTQIGNFDRLGTFDVDAPIPADVKPIKTKFVFKLKTKTGNDGNLEIDKYKIRLVAKGYSQIKGETFWDTFAPVTHSATTKAAMAICLDSGWEACGMDTTSAFINSTIKFDAFVEMPPGYAYKGKTIMKLNKTLEGTRQGAHDWYQEQDELIQNGPWEKYIVKSTVDPCLYVYKNEGTQALISVHSDARDATGMAGTPTCRHAVQYYSK